MSTADGRATIVLVHGGLVGPWEWERVTPLLEGAGFSVIAPTLPSVGDGPPLSGFAEDVATVRAVLDSLEAPVVACAHSFGGMVLTEAAAGYEEVVRELLYLTSPMPDAGETFLELLSTGGDAGGDAIDFGNDGTFGFDVEHMVREKVALGWDAGEARALAVRHRRQLLEVAVTPVQAVAWQTISSTYVECTRDETISRELAALCRGRAKRAVTIEADHDPQWTHPEVVAELIAQASG